MSLLSMLLLIIVVLALNYGLLIFNGKFNNPRKISRRITRIKEMGLLAFVLGILVQLISLFTAFKAIELGTVDISTLQIWDGFKTSLITPSYGICIYTFSLLIWLVLRNKLLNNRRL